MDDNTTAVAGVAVLVSPILLFLLVRLVRGNPHAQPNQADQAQTAALMATAERMERRIDSLEMLLDTELPGWRSRSRNS